MVEHAVSAVREHRQRALPPARCAARRSASALLGAFGCGAARLHIDLCRLSSAICPRRAA
ncbi:hypothetical protein ADL22_26330 [Streptomyces sp. NRRL F-4489]|uniref:putative leader peptide n=1 Tax=Streptomyces sp. NRRL F-4489 TaxID=1609095 RepID=UPI0007469075|nr:putative leader peptide [Streptomyces sp. NRRL F-4489]KUL35721.1 hypothetical protein ADL22_26330 [Streptomyces sp. NRRL F-4489]